MFSAFNPSKCTQTGEQWTHTHTHTHTHTWRSGQSTMQRPGSSWGFGALLKGLTSVVNNSCRSRDSNPQPWVTSPTLYPLGQDCQQLTGGLKKIDESLLQGKFKVWFYQFTLFHRLLWTLKLCDITSLTVL